MSKDIDQLDLSTAKEIQKWLLPNPDKKFYPSDADIKAGVRNYLRKNKLTPYDALVKIGKQNASMPKRIF